MKILENFFKNFWTIFWIFLQFFGNFWIFFEYLLNIFCKSVSPPKKNYGYAHALIYLISYPESKNEKPSWLKGKLTTFILFEKDLPFYPQWQDSVQVPLNEWGWELMGYEKHFYQWNCWFVARVVRLTSVWVKSSLCLLGSDEDSFCKCFRD